MRKKTVTESDVTWSTNLSNTAAGKKNSLPKVNQKKEDLATKEVIIL